MVTRKLIPTAIVLSLILLLGVVPAYSSTDSQERDDAGQSQVDVLGQSVSAEPSEIRGYWTKQRMRAATPVELLTASGTPELTANDSDPAGERFVVPPALPDGGRGAASDSDAAMANCTGPIACTTGEITNTGAFPNITHGKVFFTVPGVGNFVCSGTVVNSDNESVVWTAGHCVHGGPGSVFFRNWMFAPGFRNGNQPEGRWAATRLVTTTAWANNGNNSFDLAAVVVARKGGQTIQDAVGARGIGFNMDLEDEAITAIGYPAAPNPPFNGQRMMFCDSTIDMFDTGMPMPHPMGMGCDMEGGSSGGGWIHDGDTVVSNVSYGYPTNPALEDVFFGPQLTNNAQNVYDAASAVDTQPPRITKVSDRPDPFTPNGDGRKERTRIQFSVNETFDIVFTIKRNGNTFVRIVDSDLPAGNYLVTWNGRKNFNGKKVNSGKYTYSIKATDDDGNPATKSGKTTVRR
jgi:V8-like Glu-specific endopeptidase